MLLKKNEEDELPSVEDHHVLPTIRIIHSFIRSKSTNMKQEVEYNLQPNNKQ